MGKGLVNNAQNTAKADQAYTQNQTSGYISSLAPTQAQAQSNQQADYSSANAGFSEAGALADNMAVTGGFTPGAQADFLNSATSGVTSTYDILGQQAAQARAKTGGLGLGNEQSEMARQLTQAQSSAGTNARTALNQQQNQNTIAGIGGINASASGEGSLYNTATGEVSDLGHQVLQAMGINVTSQGQALSVLSNLATSPVSNQSIMDQIGQGLSIGGSIAGGIAGGMKSGLSGIAGAL